MKKPLKTIAAVSLQVALTPIFIFLLFLLFLFMPVQFLVSSWHLYRGDEKTEGLLLDVHVVSGGEDTYGTRVRYTYEVSGKTHESARLGPGLFDGTMTETGGGRLAGKYRGSRKVTVHYDSSDPSFAFLEYGWPRWSIGFSLLLWGLCVSKGMTSGPSGPSGPLLRHALVNAVPLLGLATMLFFPQYVTPSDALHLAWLYAMLTFCHLVRGFYKRRRLEGAQPADRPAAAGDSEGREER